jgi:hypothetical protein
MGGFDIALEIINVVTMNFYDKEPTLDPRF